MPSTRTSRFGVGQSANGSAGAKRHRADCVHLRTVAVCYRPWWRTPAGARGLRRGGWPSPSARVTGGTSWQCRARSRTRHGWWLNSPREPSSARRLARGRSRLTGCFGTHSKLSPDIAAGGVAHHSGIATTSGSGTPANRHSRNESISMGTATSPVFTPAKRRSDVCLDPPARGCGTTASDAPRLNVVLNTSLAPAWGFRRMINSIPTRLFVCPWLTKFTGMSASI